MPSISLSIGPGNLRANGRPSGAVPFTRGRGSAGQAFMGQAPAIRQGDTRLRRTPWIATSASRFYWAMVTPLPYLDEACCCAFLPDFCMFVRCAAVAAFRTPVQNIRARAQLQIDRKSVV